MKHIIPGSRSAVHQVDRRIRGGESVFKGDLYIHAARLARAMEAGYTSVAEWEAVRLVETDEWMAKFCGENTCGDGEDGV